MPLPLSGSGGRTRRTSAAVCPTCCLSIPLTMTSVGVGTSNEIPCLGSITSGCGNPPLSSSDVPRSAARTPTPWISSFRSYPFVTPSTMFATSDRVSPCRARSSPRSVGRVTVSSPSPCSIFMRCGTCCVSSPSGPLTMTLPGSIDTLTPAGSSIGFFPIRLMALPDETDDFAADAFALGGLTRDQTPGRRHDRRPHPPEDARQPVLSSVDAAPRLGDALEVGDDPLAARPVLELDDERVVRPVLFRVGLPAVVVGRADDVEAHDVALVL